MDEELRIEYMPLEKAIGLLWKENPKLHDIQALASSIERHGFRDAPAFDTTLNAIIDGNGRIETLGWMRDQGRKSPRGIKIDDSGAWYVPIQFGVDAESEAAAKAYAVDANNIGLMGGDFSAWDMSRLWDEAGYMGLLSEMAERDVLPVSVDAEDLDSFLADMPERPDFEGLIEEFQESAGRGTSEKDENWFYVEFYGDNERWQEMSALLEPYVEGRSKHELERDFFYEMVTGYLSAL